MSLYNKVVSNQPELTSIEQKVNVALVGFGTVGAGFYELLALSGFEAIQIKHMVVQDKSKIRSLAPERFEYDTVRAITDPEVDLVIEAISDADAAFEVVKTALLAGKNVITANKKMLASNLGFLLKLQRQTGKILLYEAAICGAIPILDVLDRYLGHDQITKIEGVFNGTANFILTEMEKGRSYAEALQQAQELGLAEVDPTSDVDGWDAKYKLILASAHAFGNVLELVDVPNFGIRNIGDADFAFARKQGLKIRLKATACKDESTVIPTFVGEEDAAFSLEGEDNCVQIQTTWAGKQRLFGPGAGGLATATALLGDVKRILTNKRYAYKTTVQRKALKEHPITWYYVHLSPLDTEGVEHYETVPLQEEFTYLVKAALPNLAKYKNAFVAALPKRVVLKLLEGKEEGVRSF